MPRKPATPKESREPVVHCAFTEMVKTETLKENPKNPNRHPQPQIVALARIITAQGWRAPITVSRRSGLVVRGHGRLMAARMLDLDTVPVDWQDYGSEAEELADLIADNRIAELAETDDTLLKTILAEVSAEFTIELTGYEADDVAELLAAVNEENAVGEGSAKGRMSKTKPIVSISELLVHPPATMVWGLVGVPADRFVEIADTFEQWGQREGYSIHLSPTGRDDGVVKA